jgi:pyruvate formate lyase activating enzyme
VVLIKVNFGGFVSLSSVDWRGRAVCTVFLRGCPLQCSYCQNESIQTGEDFRNPDEIVAMIRMSRPFVSGVVFSGGEPTMQQEALMALAKEVKQMDLAVGIQTNGFFPDTLQRMIEKGLVDKVALDYKTRWEGFSKRWEGFCNVPKENYLTNVRKSISICRQAYMDRILSEFEVVITVFPGNEGDAREISDELVDIPLVLAQGEHKISAGTTAAAGLTNGEYMVRKNTLMETHPPLSHDDLIRLADDLGRPVTIRTRERGELLYEGNRSRRTARKRKR